jgi:hypothetical protein
MSGGTPPADPYLAERIRTAIVPPAREQLASSSPGACVFVTGPCSRPAARRDRNRHWRAVPDPDLHNEVTVQVGTRPVRETLG